MKDADYIGLGFCSNDHLAVLPFIPMDTKVRTLSHAIMGGGPAANSTAGAAALGMSAAVSAIKCRGLSGRPPSAPTRAEVEEFLKTHKEI